MRKLITNQKAITLIALVVTIIVLLTLAGVTITSVISDDGVIKKAQEAKFKMEASSYKEIEYNKQLLMKQGEVSNIYTLKEILNSEIETLEKGIQKAGDTNAMLLTAEGGLSTTHDVLLAIQTYLTQYFNSESEKEKNELKTTIEQQMKPVIDDISQTIMFDGKKLLDGTYSYTLEFGDKTFEQGSLQITIGNMSWNSLYGNEEIDYNNSSEALGKVEKAIQKVSNQRSILDAKQGIVDEEGYSIYFMNKLKDNISKIITDIFGDGTTTITEEESIEYANSKKTELNFIILANGTLENIDNILTGTYQLAQWSTYDTDDERQSKQNTIDELIKEIERQLKCTKVINKKFLQGYLPYLDKIDVKKMRIDNISVKTPEKSKEALENINAAKNMVSNAKTILNTKQNEIKEDQNYETTRSKYAFNIKNISEYEKINEKLNDEFSIINGKLFYTGKDKNKKKWSEELEIEIQENI